jgi:UDP-3-O-[3-hydroxymyristoyl] N-acetylglucosamine deacetylase/3-hydroxyacyl-[acyl-carrier-protein] dehydratase
VVSVRGAGLLLGEEAVLMIEPAEADHGIVFERTDLDPPVRIPAIVSNTTERARRTTLRSGDVSIETIEHCMSALAGMHIDNALVKVDGPEVPLGDGSAFPFVEPIERVGLVEQNAPRKVIRVEEPIVIQEGDSMIAAFPCEQDRFEVLYDLDYGENEHRIARQSQAFVFGNGTYRRELAEARTFSLEEEARGMWERGHCRHLSPKDVLVIGDDGPIDNEYRFHNEPVRHKILDLIGDLYLTGAQIHGRIIAVKSGHALNRRLARALMEKEAADLRQRSVRRSTVMDIRAIQKLMPHRYPMLLVDRVTTIEGEHLAIGVKNVTINEPFFEGHYPATPIMPGVLIVEAMAQLGGLLLSRRLEHTGKIAVLLSLDKVKLRRPVSPGDQLILEARTLRATARTASIAGTAYVGSQLAAEARIRFMMVDAEED